MARKKSPPKSPPAIAGKIAPGGTESEEESFGKNLVKRRSVEWREHHIKWQWLQDSYEGGQRYRQADYGWDRRGRPVRNLLRHRSEMPDPLQNPNAINALASGPMAMVSAQDGRPVNGIEGTFGVGAAPGATAQDDDYEMRRSRTTPPEFVSEAIAIHLAKIFDQEIHREGPPELMDWWKNVDGRGTPMDEYMQGLLAPLLLTNATLPAVLDRPRLAPGQKPPTNKYEEKEMGLDRCVLSYVLPQNLVWGVTDHAGNYIEALVHEWHANPDVQSSQDGTSATNNEPKDRYSCRHWTPTKWTLYSADGSDVIARGPNEYGFVPIVQLVDQPLFRQPMVGKSRYERVAGLQFCYYNVDSEMILSNVVQAHAVLSGPEDFCKPDQSVPVGPGNILPMKAIKGGGGTTGYQNWEFVAPSKDPFNSLRQYCLDLIDMKDTAACLTKPAGVSGTSANSVAQSGTSKTIDSHTGDKLLTAEAKMLARTERILAEWALRCLLGRPLTPADRDSIKILYPGRFQLFGAAELCDFATKVQLIAASAGDLPLTVGAYLNEIVKASFPGMPDGVYQAYEKEIKAFLDSKSDIAGQRHELHEAAITSTHESMVGSGSVESEAGTDPTGQSSQTALSGMVSTLL